MFDVSDTAYDNFMGRYSMRLAPVFADFAGVTGGTRVLDVGAGTGALTVELLRRGADVAAIDPSPSFAESLARRLPDAEVVHGPAEELPWPDESFGASLAQLVLTFMNDAPRGVAQMRRVVEPGGVVAACMWDRDGMDMLAAIARTQRAFGAAGATTEVRTMYRTREEVEAVLSGEGFTEVETELLEVQADYSGFDEFWSALGGGAGPAGVWMRELADERREAVRETLREELGSPEGAFSLSGRAWATRATRA